jgi:hypothetical protein
MTALVALSRYVRRIDYAAGRESAIREQAVDRRAAERLGGQTAMLRQVGEGYVRKAEEN